MVTPDASNLIQPPFDGAQTGAELVSDLAIGQPFHFQQCDLTIVLSPQALDSLTKNVRQLGSHFRRRNHIRYPGDACPLGLFGHDEYRLAVKFTTPPPLGIVFSDLIDGPALNQHRQNLPKIIAVIKFGKTALLNLMKKLDKRLLHDVLFILGSSSCRFQLAIGEPDQAIQESLPDALSRFLIAYS
jgi:hypothetical protein